MKVEDLIEGCTLKYLLDKGAYEGTEYKVTRIHDKFLGAGVVDLEFNFNNRVQILKNYYLYCFEWELVKPPVVDYDEDDSECI